MQGESQASRLTPIGRWCMSDEAAPYYVDMVDQQTIGHQFLLSNFGPSAIPKTGWQVRVTIQLMTLLRRIELYCVESN